VARGTSPACQSTMLRQAGLRGATEALLIVQGVLTSDPMGRPTPTQSEQFCTDAGRAARLSSESQSSGGFVEMGNTGKAERDGRIYESRQDGLTLKAVAREFDVAGDRAERSALPLLCPAAPVTGREGMVEETDPIHCPNCFRPMRLLSTIKRAFTEDVFRCRQCGVSTTRSAKQSTKPG
jgi:hypothetical protein